MYRLIICTVRDRNRFENRLHAVDPKGDRHNMDFESEVMGWFSVGFCPFREGVCCSLNSFTIMYVSRDSYLHGSWNVIGSMGCKCIGNGGMPATAQQRGSTETSIYS